MSPRRRHQRGETAEQLARLEDQDLTAVAEAPLHAVRELSVGKRREPLLRQRRTRAIWPKRPQGPRNELLLRVFREDILACPCGGRRKVIAFIDEKLVIERILSHLGLPTTGPPTAPARLPAPAETSFWRDVVPELQRSRR